MTNAEMDTDMMEMMVEDWMFEHQDEMSDLVLDGEPYYDNELSAWRQDAHDTSTSYALIEANGNISIEYMGTI